jgi:hypothetical protein
MSNHSPLPWKTGAANEDGELIYDALDRIVASAEDTSKFCRSAETEGRENANAALIVASVNCRDALLEVAEEYAEACAECEGTGIYQVGPTKGEPCTECTYIREAIAKAQPA